MELKEVKERVIQGLIDSGGEIWEFDPKDIEALVSHIESLEKSNKYLELIIENGLGPDDLKNDITMPNEI